MTNWRGRYPDWRSLLRGDWDSWEQLVAQAQRSPVRVLVATGTGGTPIISTVDSLLAAALTARGIHVSFLLCDESLPACFEAYAGRVDMDQFAEEGPPASLCQDCFSVSDQVYRDMGLPVLKLGSVITALDRREALQEAISVPFEKIVHYRKDGVAVGDYAMASTLRYFIRSDLHGEALAEKTLRRYLWGALLTQTAVTRIFRNQGITTMVGAHGFYVPDGVVLATAESLGIRAVNWRRGERTSTLALAQHQPVHLELVEEPIDHWQSVPWSDQIERVVMDYIDSRAQGKDWIHFGHRDPDRSLQSVTQRFGVDFDRPVIGLATNVSWDARLLYPGAAFSDILQWVLATIEYFRCRPELQLLIRIHPGEMLSTLPTRQPLLPEIHKNLLSIPDNVFVIPPDANVDTYAVLRACNSLLFYGSTTGLELACQGLPVICCGGFVWLRNKGLTIDIDTQEQYRRVLDTLPIEDGPVSQARMARARRYAFHWFFRRAIPVPLIRPGEGYLCHIDLPQGLDSLKWGGDDGLDIICRGIIEDTPFIYHFEESLATESSL